MADSLPLSPSGPCPSGPGDEDLFAQRLAALHADLLAGRAPAELRDESCADGADLPLARAVACLKRLERVRRVYREHFPAVDELKPAGSDEATKFPRRLGRFEIQQELGRGGQSVVFLARDPLLGRSVALKMPRPEVLLTPAMRERFLREGRATSTLKHPNLLTVYEAGELGPVVYLAQAYCPGPTLAQWLRQQTGPIDCQTAATIVAALATGMAHAHARGVLHRDLKPSNVLLEPRELATGHTAVGAALSMGCGASPRRSPDSFPFTPQVADFGLAKLLDEAGDATASGMLLGTFAYMAPEQAGGRAGEVGRATDVYGLGAILYELLAGRPPYLSDSVTETLRQIAHDDPPRLAKLRCDVPRDLEAICLRCLEKLPSRRYASAQELADELGRFLRGEPTLARPLKPAERLVKWSRRHPAWAGLIAVSVWATLSVLGVSLWANARLATLLEEARAARHVADVQTHEAERYAYTADLRLLSQAFVTGHMETGRQILARHAAVPGLARLRGFEWWYLWREFHERSQVVVRLPGGATSVATCRARGWIAAGGQDGKVRIFDQDRALVRELAAGLPAKINAVTFTHDGTLLAAAYEDGAVRLWRLPAGEVVADSLRHAGWVAAVAFSPDGTRLASGGQDGVVRLWSTESGQPAGELKHHVDTIRALAFAPNQPLLVSAGEDGKVLVWNTERLALDQRLTSGELSNVTGSWACALAFEDNGEALCASFRSADLVFWNTRPARFGVPRLPIRELARVRALAAGPNSRLALGLENSTIRASYFGNAVKSSSVVLRGHDDRIEGLAYGPGDNQLVSASRDGTVRQWQIEQAVGELAGDVSRESDRPLLWREHWLALARRDQLVRVLSMPGAKLLDEVRAENPAALAIAPRQGRLVWADSQRRLSIRDVQRRQTLRQLTLPELVLALEINPDGSLLAATSSNTVTILALPEGKLVQQISLPSPTRRSLWLADSRRCVTGGVDGRLRIWDARTGRMLAEHLVDDSQVVELDLTPDAAQLLTISDSRKVRIWNTATWQVSAQITLEQEPHGLRFLGDTGRLLASPRNQSLEIWETASGQALLSLPRFGSWPACACTSTGDQIAVSVDDRVWILDGRPATPIAAAKAEVP